MKERIALIIKNLAGRGGGAERIFCELTGIFVELGYQVTCLHYDQSKQAPAFALHPHVELINLYPRFKRPLLNRQFIQAIPSSALRNRLSWQAENGFFVAQLKRYLTNVRPQFAVSLLPPANTATLVAGSSSTVKIITCNHSLPAADYASGDKWSQNNFDKYLRVKMLDRADAIHVLFPSFIEWFPKNLQDKVFPIPNYISTSFAKEGHPDNKRQKTVLAVGRLTESKNYKILIEAWGLVSARFPEWTLKIYGSGPQRQELSKYIIDEGVAASCFLLGHSENLDIEYQSSSIFVHPSLVEGFGLAPAEALHQGLPVVALKMCSGVTEFVKHKYNGLLVNNSATEIADAIVRLICDAELRRVLSANAPGSVSQFSVDRYREDWSRLLDGLK